MLFILTSLALPLTSGFTAEFLILYGAFAQGLAAWRSGSGALLLSAAVLASLGMVLGAAYMLRFARSILFRQGARASPPSDLRVREIVPLLAPLLLILWLGITPAPVMSKVQDVVSRLSSTPAIADARKAHGN
jgi:NADH-quinone oxidoreductase subunit M